MVFAVALITLRDFLFSDALSLPLVQRRSALAGFRALDGVVSSAEFIVPAALLAVLVISIAIELIR